MKNNIFIRFILRNMTDYYFQNFLKSYSISCFLEIDFNNKSKLFKDNGDTNFGCEIKCK